VRDLALVGEEVHRANGVGNAAGPAVNPAARYRGGTLAAERSGQAPAELRVFVIEVLTADRVSPADELVIDRPQADGDALAFGISHICS
jgi:hypothetical protein